MASEVLDKFGRVDVLVNNAAIRPQKSLLEMSDEDWDQVISVDLNGAFYLSRALLPQMVDAGWGRIVNMSRNERYSWLCWPRSGFRSKARRLGPYKGLQRNLRRRYYRERDLSAPSGLRSSSEHAEHIHSQLSRSGRASGRGKRYCCRGILAMQR